MGAYTKEFWLKNILPAYLQVIEKAGGKATEPNIIKALKTNRNRVHSHLLKASNEFGLIKRVSKLGGQEVVNNNIWELTEKGKELLDKA